jgi:hypothetical protein
MSMAWKTAAALAASLLLSFAAAAHEGVTHDAAAGGAPPPAALPQIDDTAARAAAQRARDEVVAARQRLDRANAAYGQMRARDYPRGDARADIVRERDAARAEYLRASARYTELVEQLQQGE